LADVILPNILARARVGIGGLLDRLRLADAELKTEKLAVIWLTPFGSIGRLNLQGRPPLACGWASGISLMEII
jgi:hypothetical protein